MILKQKFIDIYGKEPEMEAFTPYRDCPLGAHVDHQHGFITGFAIDKGINIVYNPKENGVIEIRSMQFPKRAQWHVASVPEVAQGDWADHLRGATLVLNAKYRLTRGLSGVISGELPIGGLSSSAAVIITFMSALAKLNSINLTEQELIDLAQKAENEYVGVACGKLDQSCEVYSKKDNLLYMDMKDGSYKLIPTNPNMKPYKIAIFFSGLERSLSNSKFNARVDECRAASYALKAFEGIDYDKFNKTYLRDVPYEIYLKHRDKLPLAWKKRAEHFYTECDRVQKGAKAWEDGDLDAFGKLIFESGYSSIHNFEAGSPELIKLYELMRAEDGVYGGRFSGAGFKGCCLAIIDPDKASQIETNITKKYLEAFPHLEGKYAVYICNTADGVNLKG